MGVPVLVDPSERSTHRVLWLFVAGLSVLMLGSMTLLFVHLRRETDALDTRGLTATASVVTIRHGKGGTIEAATLRFTTRTGQEQWLTVRGFDLPRGLRKESRLPVTYDPQHPSNARVSTTDPPLVKLDRLVWLPVFFAMAVIPLLLAMRRQPLAAPDRADRAGPE